MESKKAEQNADSKKIPQLKKAGEDTAPLMERMKALSAEIKEGDAKLAELEEKQKDLLLSLPNLPDEDVCAGGKEQNQLSAILRSSLSLTMSRKTTWSFAKAWG